MLTRSDLDASISSYELFMANAIVAARQLQLPQPITLSFTTGKLSAAAVERLAGQVATGKRAEDASAEYLYVFRLSDGNREPIDKIMDVFRTARASQAAEGYHGKKNLCRGNEGHAPSSSALYVGRSAAPRKRLREHLLASTQGTYAMHLTEWATRLDLHVDFYLYRFESVSWRALQVLEDGLWDYLRPLLGRRGER